jgi:hypothetical protein
VEVPIKTTQLPVPKMRGSSTASNQDPASMQATKEIEEKSSKSVNASQPSVDEHLVGSIHPVEGKPPQPSFSLHTLAGTSEHPDSRVLGNHEESSWVHEISSTISILENQITKAYNCRQTFLLYDCQQPSQNSDPKTMAMAECKPLARTETIEGCNPSRK